jgi:hypothetical protein
VRSRCHREFFELAHRAGASTIYPLLARMENRDLLERDLYFIRHAPKPISGGNMPNDSLKKLYIDELKDLVWSKKAFADCTTRKSIVMGSGSVLIGTRSQAATSIQAVRPDSISQTGAPTWLTPPYVHSILAARPAVVPATNRIHKNPQEPSRNRCCFPIFMGR